MVEIDKLTDLSSGLSLNMGVMGGEAVPNVISDYARETLDIRYEEIEQIERVKSEFERLKNLLNLGI